MEKIANNPDRTVKEIFREFILNKRKKRTQWEPFKVKMTDYLKNRIIASGLHIEDFIQKMLSDACFYTFFVKSRKKEILWSKYLGGDKRRKVSKKLI